MKKILCFYLVFFFLNAAAHPPTGIVCDSKGNIFYSDLVHVWKLEPSGRKTIVIQNVHTHDLYIDAADNLYGQHSIYSGEATNKYYHYVWRLNKYNKLDTVVPLREGFYIENYSFARDSVGNMYWVRHRRNKTSLMKTTPNGVTTKLVDGDFKRVQWIHVSKGYIYYVNHAKIYFINKTGRIKVFADKFNEENHHNSLFGIWSDKSGNIYVANTSKHIVQKISLTGDIKTVYKSPGKWYATGGTFDKQGKLWILEGNEKNEIRVTKAPTS